MVTWDCQALNILAGYLRETTSLEQCYEFGAGLTVVQCLQFWGAFPKIIVSQLWSQVLSLPTSFNDSVFPETKVQTNINKQRRKFTCLEMPKKTPEYEGTRDESNIK